jgi:hypothetical protein
MGYSTYCTMQYIAIIFFSSICSAGYSTIISNFLAIYRMVLYKNICIYGSDYVYIYSIRYIVVQYCVKESSTEESNEYIPIRVHDLK